MAPFIALTPGEKWNENSGETGLEWDPFNKAFSPANEYNINIFTSTVVV
jgi:hypothetical protein